MLFSDFILGEPYRFSLFQINSWNTYSHRIKLVRSFGIEFQLCGRTKRQSHEIKWKTEEGQNTFQSPRRFFKQSWGRNTLELTIISQELQLFCVHQPVKRSNHSHIFYTNLPDRPWLHMTLKPAVQFSVYLHIQYGCHAESSCEVLPFLYIFSEQQREHFQQVQVLDVVTSICGYESFLCHGAQCFPRGAESQTGMADKHTVSGEHHVFYHPVKGDNLSSVSKQDKNGILLSGLGQQTAALVISIWIQTE